MNFPAELKYTKEHERIKTDDDIAAIEIPALQGAEANIVLQCTGISVK